MKNVYKSIMLISLLFHLFFINNYEVFGQEKVNIFGGVGLPEQLVIGPSYQLDQVQVGVGIGISQYQKSVSGDISYHFGGSSQKSDRRPWYLK